MLNLHVFQRVIEIRTAVAADFVCSTADCEHAAQVLMTTTEGRVESPCQGNCESFPPGRPLRYPHLFIFFPNDIVVVR